MSRRPVRQVRCTLCETYDLPCGSATHDNALTQYLPLATSMEWRADAARTVPVAAGEDTRIMRRPARPDYVPPSYSYVTTYQPRRGRTWWLLPILTALAVLALGAGFAYAVLVREPATPRPASTWCQDGSCTMPVPTTTTGRR